MTDGGDYSIVVDNQRFYARIVPENLFEIKARLLREYSFSAEAMGTLLSDLKVGKPLVFEPTIFIGNDDCVAAEMLKAISKEFGLYREEVNCEALASPDTDFIGYIHSFSRIYKRNHRSIFSAVAGHRRSASAMIVIRNLHTIDTLANSRIPRELAAIAAKPKNGWLDRYINSKVGISYISMFLTTNAEERCVPYEIMGMYRPIVISRGLEHEV